GGSRQRLVSQRPTFPVGSGSSVRSQSPSLRIHSGGPGVSGATSITTSVHQAAPPSPTITGFSSTATTSGTSSAIAATRDTTSTTAAAALSPSAPARPDRSTSATAAPSVSGSAARAV